MKTTNKQRNLNLKTCHKLLLLAAGCLWLLPASAWAQYDMYLKVYGLEGESTSQSHPNTSPATGFSFAVTKLTNGAPCGSFADLTVTKFVDKTSPTLMLWCAVGRNLDKVWLYVQTPMSPSPQDYLVIALEDVRISSVNVGSSLNGQPTEVVTFRFTRATMTYTIYDQDGNPGGQVHACYNTYNCSDCSK